jgi:hypothetical protein
MGKFLTIHRKLLNRHHSNPVTSLCDQLLLREGMREKEKPLTRQAIPTVHR